MADDSEDPVKNPIEKVAEELRAEYEASWEATLALHPEREQHLKNVKEKLDEEWRAYRQSYEQRANLPVGAGRFESSEEMFANFQRILLIAMEEPPENDTNKTASED